MNSTYLIIYIKQYTVTLINLMVASLTERTVFEPISYSATYTRYNRSPARITQA